MQYSFNSHGVKFNVEGDGFVRNNARDDFERGCAEIEKHIDSMSEREVKALHAAMVAAGGDDDPPDWPYEARKIEAAGNRVATDGWHDPNGAFLAFSAA